MNKDWIEVELGEICDFKGGGTPSKSNPDYWNGNIPWASIKDIKGDLLTKTQDFISEDGLNNSSANIAEPDEIIIGTRINPGRPIITKIRTAVNQDLKIIKPKINVSTNFLFYSFKNLENAILKVSSGTTVLGINLTNLRQINFPLAPLPEQRAIVAKIEQLFSELDNGIQNLKTAQRKLTLYRQAVLKKAFEGGFTEQWRKEKGLENEFSLISLKNVIEKPKYGTSKKCSSEIVGTPVLRIPNIRNNVVDSTELKYAVFEEDEISNLSLIEGDLLTIRSNGSVDIVGRCAIITRKDTAYLYAGYLIRLRPNQEKISSRYLLYCLNSHELRIQIESKSKSTSGVNNINSGELQSLFIPFCPLPEQNQIVQEIESRLSICDKVQEAITQNLQKAEALRQSILKKAFAGNLLTQQELTACRNEPDYAPASELLKEIVN
jgi:type I restriction enzyme S subunit